MSKYEEYVHRHDEGYLPEFYTVDKLPSGMEMEFSIAYDNYGDTLVIYPSLTIYKKRKKMWPDDWSTTTGRDGLLPAIKALKMLKKLEDNYRGEWSKLRVCIRWTDSRRRDVYYKVLGKRGYHFDMWDGRKVLTKLIVCK